MTFWFKTESSSAFVKSMIRHQALHMVNYLNGGIDETVTGCIPPVTLQDLGRGGERLASKHLT